MKSEEALRRTRTAIVERGLLKEIACACAERYRWRGRVETFVSSLCHQLDPEHPHRYPLETHIDITLPSLGYDPVTGLWVIQDGPDRAA